MNLDHPGKLHDDGVFVFDKPVPVLYKHKGEIRFANAVAYTSKCDCGICVYVEPWVEDDDDSGFAIRSWALKDL